MKIDLTIRKILQEIKEEIKEENNIDLSEQELYDIVDSQFKAVSICMMKGLEVRLPIIGSFKRLFKKDIIESINEVDVMNIVNENEQNEAILASKLKFLNNRKKKQEKMRLHIKSVEDLKELDDIKVNQYPYKKIFNNEI